MILIAGDMENSGTALAWGALRSGTPALDAGVMDGRTRASGAVGGLQGFAHPVSIARAVMARLPHVLLIGAGAARFAAEIGAVRAALLTDAMRTAWDTWCDDQGIDDGARDRAALVEAVWGSKDPTHPGGTTVYLAQDANGDIAAATSTSGWAWKYPGRLGDTPVAGAGFYADNRYGAAACTGMCELAIRTGLARSTVLYMKMGMTVAEAVGEALQDVLSLPTRVQADLTLYAIDAQGNHDVGGIHPDGDPMYYYVAAGDAPTTVRREARYLDAG